MEAASFGKMKYIAAIPHYPNWCFYCGWCGRSYELLAHMVPNVEGRNAPEWRRTCGKCRAESERIFGG